MTDVDGGEERELIARGSWPDFGPDGRLLYTAPVPGRTCALAPGLARQHVAPAAPPRPMLRKTLLYLSNQQRVFSFIRRNRLAKRMDRSTARMSLVSVFRK